MNLFWQVISLDWTRMETFSTTRNTCGCRWPKVLILENDPLQGRGVYMFSRLYNEVEKKAEWLEAAKIGLEFIKKHGRDEKGHVYFATARNGEPAMWQRKPYGAVFFVQAFLEYGKATADEWCLKEALSLFAQIREWIR